MENPKEKAGNEQNIKELWEYKSACILRSQPLLM